MRAVDVLPVDADDGFPQHELAVLDGAGLGEAADLRHGKRKPGSQQAGELNIRADERGQQHFGRRNGDGLFARLGQRDVGGHLNILFLEDGFNEGVDVAHVLGADRLMLAGFAAGFLAESLLEQGQRELTDRSVHDGLQAVIRIGLIGVQRGDVADALAVIDVLLACLPQRERAGRALGLDQPGLEGHSLGIA